MANRIVFKIVLILLFLLTFFGCSGSISWTYYLPKADIYVTLQYPRNEVDRCYAIFSRDSTRNEISEDLDYMKIISSEYTYVIFLLKPNCDTIFVSDQRICEHHDSNVFSFVISDSPSRDYKLHYGSSPSLPVGDDCIALILDEYTLSCAYGLGPRIELHPIWRQKTGEKKRRKHCL